MKDRIKRKYHRDSRMSKVEIKLIMILFHDSGYRCLKHFYLENDCKQVSSLRTNVGGTKTYNYTTIRGHRSNRCPLIV